MPSTPRAMRAVGVTPRRANSARLLDVAVPRPGPRQALVGVHAVGIDGTDTEINAGLYGEAPPGAEFLIIGHEAIGRVERVGRQVTAVHPGDTVVATVRRPDRCPNCRAGESDMCLAGHYTERGIRGAHGYMAEYYAEDERFLVRIPPRARGYAVLLEPMSIVEKALRQAWDIQRRMVWQPRRAVVLGAGPIGLLATILLRLKGLETHVFATTPEGDARSNWIAALGASYHNVQRHPVADVHEQLGQVDLLLEATGNSSVAFQAMSVMGTNAVLCLTGVSGGNKRLQVPSDVLNLSLVLGNKLVFGSVNANRRYFEHGLRDMQAGERRWPGALQKLITRRVPFSRWREALDRRPEDIKTVLDVTRLP